MYPMVDESGERQRKRKRVWAAVDRTYVGNIGDCSVNKERGDCKSEASRQRRCQRRDAATTSEEYSHGEGPSQDEAEK